MYLPPEGSFFHQTIMKQTYTHIVSVIPVFRLASHDEKQFSTPSRNYFSAFKNWRNLILCMVFSGIPWYITSSVALLSPQRCIILCSRLILHTKRFFIVEFSWFLLWMVLLPLILPSTSKGVVRIQNESTYQDLYCSYKLN